MKKLYFNGFAFLASKHKCFEGMQCGETQNCCEITQKQLNIFVFPPISYFVYLAALYVQ